MNKYCLELNNTHIEYDEFIFFTKSNDKLSGYKPCCVHCGLKLYHWESEIKAIYNYSTSCKYCAFRKSLCDLSL